MNSQSWLRHYCSDYMWEHRENEDEWDVFTGLGHRIDVYYSLTGRVRSAFHTPPGEKDSRRITGGRRAIDKIMWDVYCGWRP